MDDLAREVYGYPTAPPDVVDATAKAFEAVGQLTRALPPIPWVRSLQTYPLASKVDQLGMSARSAYMPQPPLPEQERPSLAHNAGYPEHVKPLHSYAQTPEMKLPVVSLEEVALHHTESDAWIAIDGFVHNVTVFLHEHPGGLAVLKPFLGKDATEAFRRAGHSEEAKIVMTNFRIARLPPTEARPLEASLPSRRPTGAARRVGAGKQYTRADWDNTLEAVLGHAKQLEQARLAGKRGDKGERAEFPIALPSHPPTRKPHP